jgi:hypothetical protein
MSNGAHLPYDSARAFNATSEADPLHQRITPPDPAKERAAALACADQALTAGDLDGLPEVLQMLGVLPSPPPRRPGRNAYGQLRGRA